MPSSESDGSYGVPIFFPILSLCFVSIRFGVLAENWAVKAFARMVQLYRHLVAIGVFAAAGKVSHRSFLKCLVGL